MISNILFLILGFCIGAAFIYLIRKNKFDSIKEIAEGKIIGLETQLSDTKKELNTERNKSSDLISKLSEATTKLETQKQSLDELQKKFTLEFENLANRIFEDKSTKFTKQNQTNLDTLLSPLSKELSEFKKKVDDVYDKESTQRAELQGTIKQHFELINTISKDTQNLTNALKGDSKTQGNWGELILETILERSGLTKGFQFKTQESFMSEDGQRQRPDVILNLPNNKHMIIDSKVSLTSYERYYSSDDVSIKEHAIKEHVASIQNHIQSLSKKNYQSLYEINSPDFVLLFMPIEPALGLAIQHEEGLFYDAFVKNIVLVTPSTLLVTLRIISTIWKQEDQNKNTLEIIRQVTSLYEKVAGFSDDLIKVGNQLQTTQTTYTSAINKLSTGKGNIIKRFETIKQLGINPSRNIPDNLIHDDEIELLEV